MFLIEQNGHDACSQLSIYQTYIRRVLLKVESRFDFFLFNNSNKLIPIFNDYKISLGM